MSKEKILIVNAIPLNNGDAALVFSLYNKLKAKGHHVNIATYQYKEVIKHYPQYPFVRELGQHQIFVKLPFLKFVLLPLFFIFSQAHRKASIIIGAPGGYINSNYNIKSSLQVFKIAKLYGKKTAIYSQSVGPFNNKDTRYFSQLMKNYIDIILVRDQYSKNTVDKLKISKDRVIISKDAAFLIKPKKSSNTQSKKVAFSVREWQYDRRDRTHYIHLVKALVDIIREHGYKITFLSTCQGIDSYKNDALLADEILSSLKDKSGVSIDRRSYDIDTFINKLNEFEFVIGTRLHMCILAMTQNIPAFNISYEIKGVETYKYLNIPEYSIDYNAPIQESLTQLKEFIKKTSQINVYLQEFIPKINKEVSLDFEEFYQKVFL